MSPRGESTEKKFTDEEYLELYREGLNDYEAAEELGVSRSSTFRRRAELGLEPNGKTVVDRGEIERLHGEGLSDSEIAERLGCSKQTVRKGRAERGLELNGGLGRTGVPRDELWREVEEIREEHGEVSLRLLRNEGSHALPVYCKIEWWRQERG